jgi:hypothetical protein
MPALEVKTCWYTLSKEAARQNPEVLKNVYRLSRQRQHHFRKIARLHPTIGMVCDELLAPLDVVRRIATAPGAAEQWERARQLLADVVDRRERKGRACARHRETLAALYNVADGAQLQ